MTLIRFLAIPGRYSAVASWNIVDAAGQRFAFRRRPLYLGRDAGVDKQKAEKAALEVKKWREEDQLAFPGTSTRRIFSEISNSLPYPQPGSAVEESKRRLRRRRSDAGGAQALPETGQWVAVPLKLAGDCVCPWSNWTK